jgi:hypothetical protein
MNNNVIHKYRKSYFRFLDKGLAADRENQNSFMAYQASLKIPNRQVQN